MRLPRSRLPSIPVFNLEDPADVQGIGPVAWAAFRTRDDAVDPDGHDGYWGRHPVTQDQPKRGAYLPEAIGPVGLDLPVFDSFGPGDDLCQPLSLDRCGDDVHG